jgi:hypothetical protein
MRVSLRFAPSPLNVLLYCPPIDAVRLAGSTPGLPGIAGDGCEVRSGALAEIWRWKRVDYDAERAICQLSESCLPELFPVVTVQRGVEKGFTNRGGLPRRRRSSRRCRATFYDKKGID